MFGPSPCELYEQKERHAALYAALMKLPEKQAEEEQKRAMSQWWISALAAFAAIAIIVAVIVVSKFARVMKVR